MFSALKRWTRMGGDESKLSMPSGVKAMGQALQRKFARGVQYNMKIVIKGDRNTGKTCIFQRLQGRPFTEQYIPTNEIQAGSIHWSYKATDDIVKVDVWDVVDVGKSKKSSDSLKIDNHDGPSSNDGDDSVVADANFVDVYKGTHGVIMVFDITKPWTLQYIQKELPKVPAHIPVLVLGNHRDMEEHRLIVPEDVTSFIQTLERPDRSPPIHYAESSMQNGFGLKYIHTFLNFPFLLLQREALLQQLQVNAMDMESTLEELQIYKHTEEQDYDKYLDFLNNKKLEKEAKTAADAAAKAAEAATKTAGESSSSPGITSPSTTTAERGAQQPSPAATKDSSVGTMKRWFSGSKTNIPHVEEATPNPKSLPHSTAPSNIEEFRPEDELDAGFLNEESSAIRKTKPAKNKPQTAQARVEGVPLDESDESDSDSDPTNPMVAGFAEDISDDEELSPTKPVVNGNRDSEHSDEAPPKPRPSVEDVHLTSSEEEEEEEEEPVIILKPTPAPSVESKPSKGLKIDVKGSKEKAKKEKNGLKSNAVTPSGNVFDDWLDSPELEPKNMSFNSANEPDYTVRKVDIESPLDFSPSPPVVSSGGVDEWSLFMQEQMSASQKKTKKTDPLDDSDEEETGSRHHKKSSEKSHSKKHKKHKEKTDEGEGDKERRKHKHKHKDGEKERKTKDEEGERKKKSKNKQSKKKTTDEEGARGGPNYEQI